MSLCKMCVNLKRGVCSQRRQIWSNSVNRYICPTSDVTCCRRHTFQVDLSRLWPAETFNGDNYLIGLSCSVLCLTEMIMFKFGDILLRAKKLFGTNQLSAIFNQAFSQMSTLSRTQQIFFLSFIN